MTNAKYDVLGIGNAIVDIIARTEEDFLLRENLIKSSMRLIDAEEAVRLYDHMGPAIETSGGCAGNTVAGVASFGGTGAFIGKVADDELGRIYRHDMRSIGIAFDTAPLPRDAATPTARSMILITPDGERTMNTYLGACVQLTPADIDEAVVAASAVTYLEGYLWDPPLAKDAFRHAAAVAHKAGRKVALSLSDSFCVDRFRDEFLGLIKGGMVDILFANEGEVKALYQTASFESAVAALRADARLAIVTVGENGAYVMDGDRLEAVPAHPVEEVVDLTGAGDLFAAGFLFGYTRAFDIKACADLGALAAAASIGQIGPRPAGSLKDIARQAGYPV